MDITIGTKVRSFDFDGRDLEGDRACYVEGKVVGFHKEEYGCERYIIEVDRQVFGGEEKTNFPPVVNPPVNGTPTLWGDTTHFVEAIA